MGFPRQEYWSGLPFSPPGDIPDLGIEPVSPTLTGGLFTTESPGKLLCMCMGDQIKPRQEQNLSLQQAPRFCRGYVPSSAAETQILVKNIIV